MSQPDPYQQIRDASRNGARVTDPMEILRSLDAKISPALTRPGPLRITARDCAICSVLDPGTDCICHLIEFGSDEYFSRLDRLHGKSNRETG